MRALFAASELNEIHPGGWIMIVSAGIIVMGLAGLSIHSAWTNRRPKAQSPGQMLRHHVQLLMYHDTKAPGFRQAATRFAETFRDFVPDEGRASTVQGEIVRCVDRLASEERRNGNLNWDDQHLEFVSFLAVHLVQQAPLSGPPHDMISRDLALIAKNGTDAQDPEEVRLAFGRLIIAAADYRRLHQEPIPFPAED